MPSSRDDREQIRRDLTEQAHKDSKQSTKDELADLLREYPTWGDAAIAEREKGDRARKLLLSIEGALLGYWTDIPEAVVADLTVQIRELLGDWEPAT